RVQQLTGIPQEVMKQAGRMYATAEKATIVYAMGITQYSSGTNNVFALANLAMLTGQVGRYGTGVDPLRGQNNVQGSCDMGCLPNLFPSYQTVMNEEHRQKLEKLWGCELNNEPGLTLTEIMKAAADGAIKGMYILGENPVLSDPDSNHVKKALNSLDFLLVQDIFLTETAELADVVLPASSFAEKEGTFTNTERRVQRVRAAVPAPGEAKPDWQIIMTLGQLLGLRWQYSSPKDIMSEINKAVPIYGGITYERIEDEGLQWPCPSTDHPGTQYLHADKFARGRGKFHSVEYLPPAEVPDEEYPLVLSTGRMLYHFHTGSMSRRSEKLSKIHTHELMMIHPKDAAKYGLTDEDTALVTSRRGQITTRLQITDHVPPGTIFMTFHFKESAANILTNTATDPICKIPELKACAVRVEKSSTDAVITGKYGH
ncbi:MAG: molybdopterin-dependent oxidoreductase, partial [Bacillota bacterium]|nr:molybdopterin-dependent oxidoreductase [Bacillota bacterium]